MKSLGELLLQNARKVFLCYLGIAGIIGGFCSPKNVKMSINRK